MTLEAVWLLGTAVAGGLGIELATRFLARVHPYSYFGISELIGGLGRDLSWCGFTVRLAIPFIFGALVGLLNPETGGAAGAAAGAVGALVAVWPPLVHDHLLPDNAWDRKNEVRVVYILYIISYLLLGLAGGALAGLAAVEFAPTAIANWFGEVQVPALTNILASLVAGVVGAALLGFAKWLVQRFP